jgi:hypothetical protein
MEHCFIIGADYAPTKKSVENPEGPEAAQVDEVRNNPAEPRVNRANCNVMRPTSGHSSPERVDELHLLRSRVGVARTRGASRCQNSLQRAEKWPKGSHDSGEFPHQATGIESAHLRTYPSSRSPFMAQDVSGP